MPGRSAVMLSAVVLAALGVEASAQSFIERDSAGVRITVSAEAAWADGTGWSLSDAPVATYGGINASEGQDLWRVGGFVRTPDGRVVVLSSGHGEVRVFDESGRWLRSIGGPGNGPGELMLMPPTGALKLSGGDTLLVLDGDGVDRFLLDGSVIDSRRVDRQPGVHGPGSQLVPFAFGPNGSLYAVVHRSGSRPASGVFRPDQGYSMIPPDGAGSPRLLGWYGGLAQELVSAGSGSVPIITPFARMTTHAVGAGSGSPLYVADTDANEVHRFGEDGRLTSVIRWTRASERVRGEWVETWKKEQREFTWVQARPEIYERAWTEMTIPSRLPSLDGVAGDTEGALWVLRPETPGERHRTYDVFDASGRMLGPVVVPGGLVHTGSTVPHIGPDYFMGVWRDGFGVESVRLYGLDRRY